METTAITQLVKMVEILPEATQTQVVEHLRAYLQDLRDETEWDGLTYRTQEGLIRSAQEARKQIRDGLAVETPHAPTHFLLSSYIEAAMKLAQYEKLDDGTYGGNIPACTGVVAFAETLRQCEDELRSSLEDWLWLGIKLKHPLPVLAGIDLNKEPSYEPLAAV